jgi:hypothetical protein
MMLIVWWLTEAAVATSSTAVAAQVTDAAVATGLASLREIPRDRRHRPSHSSM